MWNGKEKLFKIHFTSTSLLCLIPLPLRTVCGSFTLFTAQQEKQLEMAFINKDIPLILRKNSHTHTLHCINI